MSPGPSRHHRLRFLKHTDVAGPTPQERAVPPGKRRPMLTRQERAQIRILTLHHVPKAIIANRLSCSSGTVGNVIKKIGSGRNDKDDDYLHVDENFKAQYPPQKDVEVKLEDEKFESDDSLPSVIVQKKHNLTIHPPSTSPPNTTGPHHRTSLIKSTRTTQPVKQRSLQSRRQKEYIDLTGDVEDTDMQVADFLSNLEHDLSCVLPALKIQDLGSPQQLFALAGWSEDDLHMLFKEALPNITITQRFILVKGLKKSSDFSMLQS